MKGEWEGKLVEMDYACFFLPISKKSLAPSFLLYPTQVSCAGTLCRAKFIFANNVTILLPPQKEGRVGELMNNE